MNLSTKDVGIYRDYTDSNMIDEHIRETVRVLNEDLGLITYASCDGNQSSYETKNKQGIITMQFVQASYIAMEVYGICRFLKLENYCKLHGFENYLTIQKRSYYYNEYYKNFNNGCLIFEFSQHKKIPDENKLIVRIHSDNITPDNLDMLRTLKPPYELKRWNIIRNRGWKIALDVIKSAI